MALKIVVDHLSGSRRGERQELDPAERIRFGRHPGNDVAFDTHRDLDASAWHAELRREKDGWALVDVGSSNGTFVGGRKVSRHVIRPSQECEVEFGNGGPRIRVYVGDPNGVVVPETILSKNAIPAFKVPPPGGETVRQTLWGRMVQPVLHPQTKKFVVIQICLAVATVAIVATAFFVILGVFKKQNDAQAEPQLTAAEIARINEEQQKKLAEMLAQEPGARVAKEANRAVFLIAFTDVSGEERPLCTGFAVGGEALATNAHCVDQIDEKQRGGGDVFAVRNREPGKRYAVKGKKRHPKYRGPLSPDVGLVRLDAEVGDRVKLAPRDALHALQKGTRMYIYGFPGRVANPAKPDASVGDGMIGRVTTFAGDPDDAANAFLVQHSAETSPGASGSPIFDAKGQVIAINVGQYMEIQERIEVDPATGRDRKVQVPAALAPGLNIAVRIDALDPLLEEWGLERVPEGAKP